MRGPKYAIPSRFTIAVHILTLIKHKIREILIKLTSDFMAGSVGVNPVIIHKAFSSIRKQT